jgi:hypothetical protein
MSIYNDGNILRATTRTNNGALFVMSYGNDQTKTQFKGIVLCDNSEPSEIGETYNNFNKGFWELSSFEEIVESKKGL